MYYVYASAVSFVCSIFVSFGMQKFLTFQDTPLNDVHKQFGRYLIVICSNLILNTVLIYFFVEIAAMWYMLAQTITTGIIAITGYIGYSKFVFTERARVIAR